METPEEKVELIKENVFANFNRFQKNALQGTPREIFNASYKINFYTSLRDFFEDLEYCDKNAIEILLSLGDDVVDDLYDEFLHMEYSSTNTYSDIHDFIEEVAVYIKRAGRDQVKNMFDRY